MPLYDNPSITMLRIEIRAFLEDSTSENLSFGVGFGNMIFGKITGNAFIYKMV
jgi:hypothetical protein